MIPSKLELVGNKNLQIPLNETWTCDISQIQMGIYEFSITKGIRNREFSGIIKASIYVLK